MQPGYEKALYLLPFDHRHSYVKGMFNFTPPLTLAQQAQVKDSKQLIYEGFLKATADGVSKKKLSKPVARLGVGKETGVVSQEHSSPLLGSAVCGETNVFQENVGVLVDEEFGASILRDARRRGYVTALSVERSGSDEFYFEYGDEYADHIEAFDPTFAKVLVRFNPGDDEAMNRRQAGRLRALSEYCRESNRHLMFELLVPATESQMKSVHGDKHAYDLRLRPDLMIEAMRALQNANVEPDVWKVEGLDRREDCERVVTQARCNGRDRVSCIVLGRGADDKKVRGWLETAAQVPGFIGFAVGRTSFFSAVADYEAKKTTREEAAQRIAAQYSAWMGIFESARGASF
jgi:myo-inositol catabolism protein IolC